MNPIHFIDEEQKADKKNHQVNNILKSFSSELYKKKRRKDQSAKKKIKIIHHSFFIMMDYSPAVFFRLGSGDLSALIIFQNWLILC